MYGGWIGFVIQYIEKLSWEQAILDVVLCNDRELIDDLVVRWPSGKGNYNEEFYIKIETSSVYSETKGLVLNKAN